MICRTFFLIIWWLVRSMSVSMQFHVKSCTIHIKMYWKHVSVSVVLGETLLCRSVWSKRSGVGGFDTAVARCRRGEEMFSCSSYSPTGVHGGETIEVTEFIINNIEFRPFNLHHTLRNRLSVLFYIHGLTDACNWLVLLWWECPSHLKSSWPLMTRASGQSPDIRNNSCLCIRQIFLPKVD